MLEQLAADTESARSGTHVEIFEIQPRFTEERRKRRKVQRIPDGLRFEARDHRLNDGTLTKKRRVHVALGRHHLVRQLFVRGELMNERQDQPHVLRHGRPDRYICHRLFSTPRLSYSILISLPSKAPSSCFVS